MSEVLGAASASTSRSLPLFLHRRVLKIKTKRPAGLDAIAELLLQGRLRSGEDTALRRLLPRQFRKRSELAFQVLGRDAIPKSILKFEHLDLFLLDTENGSGWQVDGNFVLAEINGEILLQIETGFRNVGPVQLHPFGAARSEEHTSEL